MHSTDRVFDSLDGSIVLVYGRALTQAVHESTVLDPLEDSIVLFFGHVWVETEALKVLAPAESSHVLRELFICGRRVETEPPYVFGCRPSRRKRCLLS